MQVVLLKNKVKDDPYAKTFFETGHFLPVLEHKLINTEDLVDWLYDPDVLKADAVIITSQRAVEALSYVPKKTLEKTVLNKPVFTVGPATGKYLRSIGFEDVRGEECGNSTVLVDEVLIREKFNSYVFFTGTQRRDYLPRSLDEMGKILIEKQVYKTGPRKEATSELNYIISHNDIRGLWIVFFSPNGADAIIESICGSKVKNDWNIAAIGPTTENFLQMNGLPPKAVAKLPTPDDLYEAIAVASAKKK